MLPIGTGYFILLIEFKDCFYLLFDDQRNVQMNLAKNDREKLNSRNKIAVEGQRKKGSNRIDYEYYCRRARNRVLDFYRITPKTSPLIKKKHKKGMKLDVTYNDFFHVV